MVGYFYRYNVKLSSTPEEEFRQLCTSLVSVQTTDCDGSLFSCWLVVLLLLCCSNTIVSNSAIPSATAAPLLPSPLLLPHCCLLLVTSHSADGSGSQVVHLDLDVDVAAIDQLVSNASNNDIKEWDVDSFIQAFSCFIPLKLCCC